MHELFKKYNLKVTKQREIVFNLINELGDNATLKNICDKCINEMDNSTVYRIIDSFLEKGIFEKSINYNDEIYYLLKEEHGHYITCIKCHKKEKIDKCPLDKAFKDLQDEKGYKILDHTVHLDGICKDCQNK